MINKLSFGQYIHKNSIIHRLDPRIKVVYVVILSSLIFLVNQNFEIILFSVFMVSVNFLSRIELRQMLKKLVPFYYVFIFILLMYAIFARNKLNDGLFFIWQFLILIMISCVLTFTTTVSDLILALEELARPLRMFGIKPRNVSVMISIAIRFVPVMFSNLEKTKEAMLTRLANFRKSSQIKLIVLVLIERMLKSASTLSDSMISRQYDENASGYRILELKPTDYISMLIVFLLTVAIY